MHAGHRGVVHARYRDAERHRAQHQLHAALASEEHSHSAVGGGDRDRDRQHHQGRVMRHRKIAGQRMHADIVHDGDTDP
jgi:hypothetical protein